VGRNAVTLPDISFYHFAAGNDYGWVSSYGYENRLRQ
jgi:hypothetical protein